MTIKTGIILSKTNIFSGCKKFEKSDHSLLRSQTYFIMMPRINPFRLITRCQQQMTVLRYCHHDRHVKLQDYHIIGLHQNLRTMTTQLTLMRQQQQTLQEEVLVIRQLLETQSLYDESQDCEKYQVK